jgi:hypothetical protein
LLHNFCHILNYNIRNTINKTKKVLKSEKIEDPSSCETYDGLRNCTTGVLNQFCKDKALKIGGNKKDLMDRVWRHIQGETSDEDKSVRNKPKSEKKVPEKHACCGTNTQGVPCGVSATEIFNGHHFCWRHITDAQKTIVAPEPVINQKQTKISKAKESKIIKKEISKKAPRPEELVETDDDLQETDNEK